MVSTKLLYDNGRTTIKHVMNPQRNKNTLVITFAEMMRNDPSKPGFGQDFLLRHGVDMITVQKRYESWYQDLKIDHFKRAVNSVRHSYDRIVCYGISMGAFAGLYYGGSINASILAISPLCSIHPLYPELGHHDHRRKIEATQCDLLEVEKSDNPICIIYDPLQRADHLYIKNEVRPSFPNATFLLAPGSGHPSSICLSGMKLLAPIVLNFIDHEAMPDVITAMRPLRAKSPTYLETMADKCRRRNRLHTALALYNRAASINPEKESLIQKRDIVRQAVSEKPPVSEQISLATQHENTFS